MLRKMLSIFIVCCVAAGLGGSRKAGAMVSALDGFGGPPLPLRHAEARAILEQLYQDRLDSARTMADEFEANHPEDPLPLLIKARVMRETLSDQDDEKKLIEWDAEPIMGCLDRAIAVCDERLDSKDRDSDCYFYRGWAWMFKAQLSALSANYWSAGRSAKRGKDDLEEYLALHPGDPDASGILGTFLYFADTLPTIVKIIKSLFLIPGGDSAEGLRLLDLASGHEGILSVDHGILLSAIYTVFEGRFEDGTRSFAGLLERYPSYIRLIEPIGLLASLSPGEIRNFQHLLSRTLARHDGARRDGADGDSIRRIRYHLSYSHMFFNPPEQAIQEFTELLNDNPERPDWLRPLSMLNLGVLCANTGQKDKARRFFQTVLSDGAMHRFHDVANTMLDGLDEGEGCVDGVYSRLVAAIYDRRFEESRSLLEEFKRASGETVYSDFYQGEMELLAGNRAAAEHAYRCALDRSVPSYAEGYQMLAAFRLAEIRGAEKDYRAAAGILDGALEYYHKEFLADMLIKGRKRLYSGLADGSIETTPSLMLPGASPILPASVLDR
ncbi:MAG: hypothetical protein HY770_03935 [Chitinivibrionia bacterium]|nr:hypothetical protein [Chitinivibrionia bacterium]